MLKEIQAKVFLETCQELDEYEWWDKQGKLKVFDHRKSFAWKSTKKGKRGYSKEDAPRVLRSELAAAFFDYLSEESSEEMIKNLWDGRPAYGQLILKGQALGDQAPGPRFEHLRESYEALRASVGEPNKSIKGAIEGALEKWEQEVRARLYLRVAQMTKERPDKTRRQRLIRKIDDALKTYTNLTKKNRVRHIQWLLKHFQLPVPEEGALSRSLLRKVRTKRREDL